ncbi:MAG: hypothetical protein ISP91_17370 [Pseudomonadales bacterium]|jgi:hypothetical protein|nr:hypothetical protein [Pseudomonadales bacterium]
MNTHQHSWALPGEHLEPVLILEDWLGPVTALLRCPVCDTHALIYLVAWQSPELKHRIFAVRVVPDEVTKTYLRNIRSDYCDLTRKQREFDALITAAEPASLLISVRGNQIEATAPAKTNPTLQSWHEIETEDYAHWKKLFPD